TFVRCTLDFAWNWLAFATCCHTVGIVTTQQCAISSAHFSLCWTAEILTHAWLRDGHVASATLVLTLFGIGTELFRCSCIMLESRCAHHISAQFALAVWTTAVCNTVIIANTCCTSVVSHGNQFSRAFKCRAEFWFWRWPNTTTFACTVFTHQTGLLSSGWQT